MKEYQTYVKTSQTGEKTSFMNTQMGNTHSVPKVGRNKKSGACVIKEFPAVVGCSLCLLACQHIGTLRSRHEIFFVDFDKICLFCDKYYICIDKYVFIIIKIKYINSDRICNICDKVNYITKLYIFYNT